MIRVENLFVKYGSLCAVSGVSLAIKDGEAFGIIGRNGAGKTTLIEAMEGLRKRTSGKIDINGIDPSDSRKKEELYRMISVQLQSTNYPDKAKVGDLCKLFGAIYNNTIDYRELLKKFDLLEKFNKPVSSLSGGQKQKLSILLALISRPEIVFLDELTTGLDADARHELWKYLKELKSDGVTIILVSHYMDDIEMICDRIGVMSNGQLIHVGTRDELTNASGLARRVTFTCSADILTSITDMPGVVRAECIGDQYTVITSDENFPEKCADYFDNRNILYKDFVVSRPTLEDVFLRLINENNGGDLNG